MPVNPYLRLIDKKRSYLAALLQSFYLHRINGSDTSYTLPIYIAGDNNLQEYVQLIIAKRERDILEEMLEEGASNAEYTEMEDKLAALYAKISEIRKYLHNVSPSYREKFAENHEIDSVISVF